MTALKPILERLLDGQSLSQPEAFDLLHTIATTETNPAAVGAILAVLRLKGETPDEVAGFASAMRTLARRPRIADDAADLLDIVGTGGDGSSSFNISTGSALLAAACGLRIAKHGNRAISSTCGSADVLEALGLPLPLRDAAAAECLARTSFTFLFAPEYHPAMATIAPVRRALGVRTIFNMLGPLTNPAQPKFGVIGAFSRDAAHTMAAALAKLDITRYFVIHGENGWDEATPICPFLLLDVRPNQISASSRAPGDYQLNPCHAPDLKGGDAQANAAALRGALCGAPGPLADCLVLGAALALQVAGRAEDPAEAARLARAAIQNGRAAALLDDVRAFGDQLRQSTEARGVTLA